MELIPVAAEPCGEARNQSTRNTPIPTALSEHDRRSLRRSSAQETIEPAWIVELFKPGKGRESLGIYHVIFRDAQGHSHETSDPWKAKRYDSEDEAKAVAEDMFDVRGVWCAVRYCPRFPNVSCSHCGQEFGPGDAGFSHCEDHIGAKQSTRNTEPRNADMRRIAECMRVLKPKLKGKFPYEQALEELARIAVYAVSDRMTNLAAHDEMKASMLEAAVQSVSRVLKTGEGPQGDAATEQSSGASTS